MENEGAGVLKKRMKPTVEDSKNNVPDGTVMVVPQKEENEANMVGSEDMELKISHIMEKIEQFTQLISGNKRSISRNMLSTFNLVLLDEESLKVSELMESGKTMFKDLSNEFEDQLFMIHKEQVEKWQEELKELRELDSTNEETNAVLHNARYLLQSPQNQS